MEPPGVVASPPPATAPAKASIPAQISLGARVQHKEGVGTVRFIGRAEFSKGVWTGVELDEATGKNDGAVKGLRYFQCPENHGLFAKPEKLTLLPEDTRSVAAPLYEMEAYLRSQLATAQDKVTKLEAVSDGLVAVSDRDGISPDEAVQAMRQQNSALKDAAKISHGELVKATAAAAEAEIASADKIAALEDQVAAAQKGLANAESASSGAAAALEGKVVELTSQLAASAQSSSTLASDTAALAEQLAVSRAACEAEAEKASANAARVAELEANVAELAASVGEAAACSQAADEEMVGKLEACMKHVADLEQQGRALADEKDAQAKQIAGLQGDLDAKTATAAELQERLAATQAEVAAKAEDGAGLAGRREAENAELQAQLEAAQAAAASAKAEIEGQLAGAEAAAAATKSELEGQLAEETAAKSVLEGQLAEAQANAEAAETAAGKLEVERAELLAQLEAAETAAATLEGQLAKASAKAAEGSGLAGQLEAEKAELEAKLAADAEAATSAKAEVEAKLAAEAETAAAVAAGLEAAAAAAKVELESQVARLAAEAEETAAMLSKSDAGKSEALQRLANAEAASEARNSELEAKLAAAAASAAAAATELEAKAAAAESAAAASKADLESQLVQLTTERDGLASDRDMDDMLQAQMASIKQAARVSAQEAARLQGERDTLEKQLAQSKEAASAVQSQQDSEIAGLMSRAEAGQGLAAELKITVADINAKLEGAETEAKAKESALRAELTDARSLTEEMQSALIEADRLRTEETEALQKQLAGLSLGQTEQASSASQLEVQVRALNAEIVLLKRSSETSLAEAANLKMRLETSETDLCSALETATNMEAKLQTELAKTKGFEIAKLEAKTSMKAMVEEMTEAKNKVAEQAAMLDTVRSDANSVGDDKQMLVMQNAALKEASRLAYEQLNAAKLEAAAAATKAEEEEKTSRRSIEVLKSDLSSKTSQYQDVLQISSASAEKLQLSEETVNTVMSQYVTMQETNKTQTAELAKSRSMIQKLEAAIKQSDSNLQTFQAALIMKIEQLEQRHAAERAKLTGQVEQYKFDLDQSRREASENKCSFESMVVQQVEDDAAKDMLHQGVISSMNERLAAAEDAVGKREVELKETVEHISYLKSRVEALQETLADAKEQLEPLVKQGLVRQLHDVAINQGGTVFSTTISIDVPEVLLVNGDSGQYHAYKIDLNLGVDAWSILRRYSELLELHTFVLANMAGADMLEFPPKQTFGNKDPKVVESRRIQLQGYLRRMVNLYTRDENSPLNSAPTKSALLTLFPFFSEETIDMGEINLS